MKPRTVLVLTVLVAVLAAFIWFFERDLPSSEERAERSRKVLPVDSDEVSALVVEWGGETLRIERAVPETAAETEGEEETAAPPPPGEWRITEPLRARAERSTVESLLSALTGLDKERTIEDADRTEMGLAEPRGRVTLVTGDGERTLEIGADVPASENVLVSLAGDDEVWVTRRSFLSQLEREPGEWRSRDVFSVARDDVERVRLTSGEAQRTVVLARRDERFYVEEPVRDLAAADAVDQLLSDLVTLRAQRFLDSASGEPPPPSELGLDPPRAVVVAELAQGGEPLRVELGAPVGDPETPGGAVYARAGGQLFEAVTDLDQAAARPAQEWRSRSWTELRSYEVDRVEVEESGAEPVTLVRDGVDWHRGDDSIPYTAASDFLYALTDVEGELAADGEPPALGAPILRVTLASEDGDEETLTLYPPSGGDTHPARSSARAALLLLSNEAVAEVRRALAEVRAAEPQAAVPVAGEGPGDAGEGDEG